MQDFKLDKVTDHSDSLREEKVVEMISRIPQETQTDAETHIFSNEMIVS